MAGQQGTARTGGQAEKQMAGAVAISAAAQTRRAWRILMVGVLCFGIIAGALGVGFVKYRANATRPRGGIVTSVLTGTQTQARGRQQAFWHDIVAGSAISEGDTIRTGDDTRLRVLLFDETLVELSEKTELTFAQLRASQYLDRNATISLQQEAGKVVVTPSKDSSFARTRVTLATRGATVETRQPGTSFRVLIAPGLTGESDRVDVSVLDGAEVTVTGAGQSVAVANGQQTVVRADAPPTAPAIKQSELLENGDFKVGSAARGQVPARWEVYRDDGGDGNGNRASWELVPETVRGQAVTAMRFSRSGGNVDSDLVGIKQLVPLPYAELGEYDSVVLSADVKVVSHSLSGGGTLGSEYPLVFLVRYTTATNDPAEKGRAFYTQNDAGNPTETQTVKAVQIKPGEWDGSLRWDLKQLYPAPFRLVSILVYASGHDYDAYVANLSIVAK